MSNITKVCPHCQIDKPLTEFYKRRNRSGILHYCKTCTTIQTKIRQRARKKRAVDYMGGKCQICAYNKCLGALEFHHVNPEEKDFTIASCTRYIFEKVKSELDKCILVCSNCHREIHESLRDNVGIEWKPYRVPTKFDDVELDSYQRPKELNYYQRPKAKSKIEWPPDEELQEMVWQYPRSHLSKVLKVSDVAIARYLKRRGITQPPRGYWSKLKAKGK